MVPTIADAVRRYNRTKARQTYVEREMVIMIEDRVKELKEIIASNDGRNVADARFTRAVDELVSALYDDVDAIKDVRTRALFDLFVIKVLYVGRHSCDAGIIEYLGALLDRYVSASELFPPDDDGRTRRLYFSDMLDATKQPTGIENVFETYRTYADNALFMSGVFPASMQLRRPNARTPLRRRSPPSVDTRYYVTTGKTMYRMAARDEHAGCAHQPDTLTKLADYFEVYMDALGEMSQRYILGFDMELIADKMLDAFNRYRVSRQNSDLTNAQRYAAILRLDREHFPAAFPTD